MDRSDIEAFVKERDDVVDFAAAFAIGAVLGAGAVLLLRPSRKSRRERIADELKDRRKAAGKHVRRAGKRAARAVSTVADLRNEIGEASQSAADELRREIAELVDTARGEIARTIEDQVDEARKALERSAKRLRRS